MALELGPCQILFGVAESEIDYGKTEGGVVVTFSTAVADLKSDQWGDSPEDQVIVGQGATIKVPLAEATLAKLATVLNQTLKADEGKHGFAGERLVGTRLSTVGKSLLLKKYVDGQVSTNTEDWLRFPVAAPTGNFDWKFDRTSQRVIEAVFTAFPDENDRLYFFGDETAAIEGS